MPRHRRPAESFYPTCPHCHSQTPAADSVVPDWMTAIALSASGTPLCPECSGDTDAWSEPDGVTELPSLFDDYDETAEQDR